MGNNNTRNADIEFKMSANGKSEIKKFIFSYKVRNIVEVDDYHRALFKFLMRKLSSLPEGGDGTRPEQQCTDYLITVQNKYGMMVRCHGEEEFLSALSGHHSWRKCLKMEAYGYALPESARAQLEGRNEYPPPVEAVKASRTTELDSRRIQVEAMQRQYQVSGTLAAPQTKPDALESIRPHREDFENALLLKESPRRPHRTPWSASNTSESMGIEGRDVLRRMGIEGYCSQGQFVAAFFLQQQQQNAKMRDIELFVNAFQTGE